MLVKNTFYNLVGLGVPLIAAVVSIPVLIDSLGVHRFGFLTLIWAVVSYFGLFDMGLGRALTLQLSIIFSRNENTIVGSMVATAIILMLGLGMLAAMLMALLASWGVGFVDGLPDNGEAIRAVYVMAFGMPAIILTSGFRGILEAKHAFGVINIIRLPMGLLTFLGPLAVVIYGQPRLDWIAFVLVLGRFLACVIHGFYAWKVLPADRGALAVKSNLFRPLFVSGGWLTVSNVISPLMGYVDRFLISSIVSAGAVAYYVTPQELMTKMWILPGALTMVLFPTFAAKMAQKDEETWAIFNKAIYWLFSLILPLVVCVVLFSHEILSLWINTDFADHSALLLQIFAIGILISCLTHVPFVLIQGSGNPRLTALLHLSELPLFLGVLWFMTAEFGITGAAITWLIRTVVDAVLVFILSAPILGKEKKDLFNTEVVFRALLVGVVCLGVIIPSSAIRALWFCVLCSVHAYFCISKLKKN